MRSLSADLRAWLMQKAAPFTVRYGDQLQLAGQDLPRPHRLRVPTRHGAVRCEVQEPHRGPGRATYVHLHGGAFVMRHPRMDAFLARFLAAEAGVRVVLPDYAVAPQVRYPVAHEQVHDVVTHLAREVDVLGVGGFSSGGNLAASACLRARDEGSSVPAFQLLGVPSLDVAESYDDKRPVGRPMLGPEVLDLVRATYFRDEERRTEPLASPLRAADLTRLPPAYVVTAERDLLRREGDLYAARLTEAGVPVDHHVVPGADHYFLDPHTNARTELDRMAAWVRAQVEG